MNIAVAHQFKPIDPADLAVAAAYSAGALMEADAALDRYIAAVSNLIAVGVEASATIGRRKHSARVNRRGPSPPRNGGFSRRKWVNLPRRSPGAAVAPCRGWPAGF